MSAEAVSFDSSSQIGVALLEPGGDTRVVAQGELPGAYSRLRDQVGRAGLLDHRPYRYALKIGFTIAAFAAGWATFFIVGNTWLSAGVAVLLAVLFTQVVFLGHDAGHQEIVRSARVNRLIGLTVGNALTGLSIGWWVPKHNAHHAHPNEVGRDPDIGAGLIAFGVTASSDDRTDTDPSAGSPAGTALCLRAAPPGVGAARDQRAVGPPPPRSAGKS